MKAGIVRRVVLTAIFCASLVAFDRLLAATLARATLARDQQAAVGLKLIEAKRAGTYDVLVLGTSRAFEAIHPLDIAEQTGARAYKEAFQGKAPRYHYEFYQRWRRIIGKPKVVVYAVDYFLFDLTSEPVRLAGFGTPAESRTGPSRSPTRWWRPTLLLAEDKAVNDQAIVRALQGWQAQAHPEGEPNPERYQRDMEAYRGNTMVRVGDPAEPAPARYDRIAFPRFPGKEGEYFERLLGDLEADGVEVILVGLPDFIATYRTDFEQQAFNATFESLAGRHRHCVFLNYDTPDRFPLSNASYFIDGKYGSPNSHLSRAGIKPFLHVFLPDLRKALARSANRHD